MITKQLHDGWRMRVAGDRQWFPAQVPGSVYQDLLNSGMIDDPYDRDNELAALAVMDQDFEYELEFDTPAGMLEQEAVLLRFEGIDTVADLELNGHAAGPCGEYAPHLGISGERCAAGKGKPAAGVPALSHPVHPAGQRKKSPAGDGGRHGRAFPISERPTACSAGTGGPGCRMRASGGR